MGRWLSRDDYFEAPVIPEAEAYVEKGAAYAASFIVSGVAAAGYADLMIVNGNADKELDFYVGIGAAQNVSAYLLENPRMTASGTVVAIQCLNRQANTLGHNILAFNGPTLSGSWPSLALEAMFIPTAGQHPGPWGGHAVPGFKWCLLPGAMYVVRVRNEGGSASLVSILAEFYLRDSFNAEKAQSDFA
jgi:hypothetical protein